MADIVRGDNPVANAGRLAFNQANAYRNAASLTQATQDVFSLALLRSAGFVAVGALEGVEDAVLAERAIDAALIGQASARYTPQTAVRALYQGASRMNCISLAGNLYARKPADTATDVEKQGALPPEQAAFIMILSMREIEYRTLSGTSRDSADFSTILNAIAATSRGAVETEVLPTESADSEEAGEAAQPKTVILSGDNRQVETVTSSGEFILVESEPLQEFFRVISGCLSDDTVAPDVPARENSE